MPNPFQISGAQPPRPTRKAPLYQGARWSSGLWSNRSAIRDAASTRLEEKFYGPRGDAFLGGQNLEISQRLTVIRRPGNSVWNTNNWVNVNGFYEYRLFNADTEEIKTMVDTQTTLYNASNNGQIAIWNKSAYAGQSFMQSVGNILYWGDGQSEKKWINTLQKRIPYSQVLIDIANSPDTTAALNPYNFTPFELNSFIIDTNGNAEQLIGTIVQLSSFYILDSTFVFTTRPNDVNGNPLPTAGQVLSSGLQLYFSGSSAVATVLSDSSVTLTIQNIAGGINTASVYFGGQGYTAGEFVNVAQNSPSGSIGGQVQVVSVGAATGVGYTSASGVDTTTLEGGTGCQLNLTTSGGSLVSATIAVGGTGYAIGDFIFPQQFNASGGYFTVSSVSVGSVTSVALCTGVVTAVAAHIPGTGYVAAQNVPTSASLGVGLSLNITSDGTQFTCNAPSSYAGGPLASGTIVAGGNGYAPGDTLYPALPVQSRATGASFTVASIYGVPATLNLDNGGPSFTGYTVASGLATTTSGAGTGATFNILSVSSGQIATFSLGAGGTGYVLGDSISPVQATGAGAVYTVTGVTGTTINALTVSNAGFLPYSTGTVPTTTSGSGSGATIHITGVSGSVITSGVLVTPGTGYAVGDRLYPVEASTAGTAEFSVASLTGATGGVASITLATPGTGYITEQNIPTSTSGSGVGAVINLVANNSFYPTTADFETPTVYSGGNPISNYSDAISWPTTIGATTIDGSALWINRGAAVDNGLVYNWGIAGGNIAPNVVVNGAVGSWASNTYYNRWQFIIVTVGGNKYLQQLLTSGVSAGAAPSWSTTPGQVTTDGTAQWICLSNDGDTTFNWASGQTYTAGHVIEETVSAVTCVFRLQSASGIQTAGSNFPVYCWQCNSQQNSDVGAAGEIPSGIGNAPMSPNGTQPTSTASFSGTVNSLFLSAQGGSNSVQTAVIGGDGTVPNSLTTLFPASQNLSIAMLPSLVIPAAGTYTFTIGHQVAMFWGIGSGSLSIPISKIQQQSGTLTVTCGEVLTSLLTVGVELTFGGLVNATWLNGVTVTVTSISGSQFTALVSHANYGPAIDTGNAQSGPTLTPSVISGPMNWNNSNNPNTYNFSTGTPIKGYPIMSAQYQPQGNSIVQDTVQISFPSAGVYPAEIHYGVWYHSTSGYTAPTVSPALPAATFSFYMVYSPPGSSTNYNIIPQGIAVSSGTAPTWPAWGASIADLQALSPNYPKVTEASGNYTWWNLGPVSTFGWNAAVNQTTSTFIIDQNSNEEIPYEAGVSGTAEPTFSTTLYGLTADLPNLVWMNNGTIGNTPSGTLTTTQGGWSYAVALVNTLDDTVSNASLVTPKTGNFFEASGVFISGGLPQYIDPQVDYVAIFRTDDGGATYFLIPPPASGNGNTEYTIPVSQYLTQGFTDNNLDSQLNILLQAPLALQNTPPSKGSIIPAYQNRRIFVAKKNTVSWSSGPDTPIGNGYNGFSPSNFAEFPSRVVRMVPLNIGLVVHTVSDVYLISGEGTVNDPFTSQPFMQKLGLLSYNALTVNGSLIYFMTTDKQVVELNVHSGLSVIGLPVADLIQQMNPASSYLTWHVSGSSDQCLFVADGSTGWYRMCPTPAPEVGSLTWSLKANIVGGCGAVQSIETTPGNIQLLLAPPPGVYGPLLYRNYDSYVDNGSAYTASFILGSIVMAFPGQVGAPEFITTDCLRVPNSRAISLGIRIGEVGGPFYPLTFSTNDPPQLVPSETLYNQRFYLSQTKQSVLCRHMQIQGQFEATDSADELDTLTVVGSYLLEE